MRFTEHEMTAAVTAAAQAVAKGRRRTRPWDEMTKLERFYVLDAVGDQLLPALVALPDVEVEAGTRPTFTDAQVVTAVEQTLGDAGGRLRRKVVLAARVALLKQALAALPVRQDPDALINPE